MIWKKIFPLLLLISSSAAVPLLNPSSASEGLTSSSSLYNSSSSHTNRIGCASPEVLVNGSPSPDIVETVSGGGPSGQASGSSGSTFGNIEEIQFVGSSYSTSPSSPPQKRICTIKCLNGVWVGPLCSLEKQQKTEDEEIRCPTVSSEAGQKDVKDDEDHRTYQKQLIMSSEGNKVGQKTRFSCIEGYQLIGSPEIICNSDGHWSSTPPKCKAIECPEMESDDPNLQIRNPEHRTFGSRVYYSCPQGLKLTSSLSTSQHQDENSFSTCLINSTWYPQSPPTCEGPSCQTPDAPMNGRIIKNSDVYQVGDTIEFSCDEGFSPVTSDGSDGRMMATCLFNGSWSQSPPKCERICEFPGEPENGYVVPTKFQYSVGDRISISCSSSGFRPNSIPILYCTSDGSWSSSLPKCIESTDLF